MGMSEPGRANQKLLLTLSTAAIVVAADQGSKALVAERLEVGERLVVTPFFQLVAVYNPGAAFSFLAEAGGWQRWFLLALAILITLWLIWEAQRTASRWGRLAYGLIIGGALGNGWDRALHGAVFDFLLVHYRQWAWPAFNLADSAITLGVLMLLWHLWKNPHDAP